jgi:predicted O-methyltransferase YrrM
MYEYFNKLNQLDNNEAIQELKTYALSHKVPIIQEEGLVFLIQIIRLKEANKVLEIGTAIGYSSIQMARHTNAMIDTIEKDSQMVQEANKNIVSLNLQNRIHVFEADALELDVSKLSGPYDIIFIDGAKAQYEKFFEKYEHLLTPNGIIVSDNLLFHGLVYSNEALSKNLRGLVRKIEHYIEWLHSHPKYQTLFFDIGDGMAVSERKKK